MGRFLMLLSVGVPILGLVSSVPLNVVPAKHLSYALERAQGVRTFADRCIWYKTNRHWVQNDLSSFQLYLQLQVPYGTIRSSKHSTCVACDDKNGVVLDTLGQLCQALVVSILKIYHFMKQLQYNTVHRSERSISIVRQCSFPFALPQEAPLIFCLPYELNCPFLYTPQYLLLKPNAPLERCGAHTKRRRREGAGVPSMTVVLLPPLFPFVVLARCLRG